MDVSDIFNKFSNYHYSIELTLEVEVDIAFHFLDVLLKRILGGCL